MFADSGPSDDRITSAPRRPALEKILSDGLINILFVGRIEQIKGIDVLLRALGLRRFAIRATSDPDGARRDLLAGREHEPADSAVPHVHAHLLGGRFLTWPPG